MISIVDARRCQKLQDSFDDMTISVEEYKSDNVINVLQDFRDTAISVIIHALQQGELLSKVVVPVVVGSLDFKEREEFEDIVTRVGGWISVCGDRWLLLLSPEYCVNNPTEVQLDYLSNTGRYCKVCNTFTELREADAKWICPTCGRWVSCYPDSDFAMGRIATSLERRERIETHKLIDCIWKEGLLSRRSLYKEISEVLNVPKPYAHVAMMTMKQLDVIKVWAKARHTQLVKERELK